MIAYVDEFGNITSEPPEKDANTEDESSDEEEDDRQQDKTKALPIDTKVFDQHPGRSGRKPRFLFRSGRRPCQLLC